MSTPACDDLRLGGQLGPTGITGTTVSINGTAYSVTDWSTIFGTPGLSGSQVEVFGRAGFETVGDLLPPGRSFTLSLAILDRNQSGGLTEPTKAEQKQANTDAFLSLLMARNGTLMEVDMPDSTSRFIRFRNLSPAPISQPRKLRTIRAPLVTDWGLWHEGGNQNSVTISGAGSVPVAGETVWDATLVFAGDGTFTHTGLGWAIQVTGSGGAVTVDLGRRTVTEGGSSATNRVRRTVVPGMGRFWGWFTPGANAVNATVSTDVVYRDQWV